MNQTLDFLEHVRDRSKEQNKDYKQLKQYYYNIIRKFEYYLALSNGVFITHAGISDTGLRYYKENNLDITNIDISKKEDFKFLEELVWSRPYWDYMEKEIDEFLELMDSQYWIVGHTPCEGQSFHILGNQLRYDSSFLTENDTKYYLYLDTEDEYNDIVEIVKYLNLTSEIKL